MSAGIVAICGRLAAAGQCAALVGIGGAAPGRGRGQHERQLRWSDRQRRGASDRSFR